MLNTEKKGRTQTWEEQEEQERQTCLFTRLDSSSLVNKRLEERPEVRKLEQNTGRTGCTETIGRARSIGSRGGQEIHEVQEVQELQERLEEQKVEVILEEQEVREVQDRLEVQEVVERKEEQKEHEIQ